MLNLTAEMLVVYRSKIEGNKSLCQGWCDVIEMKRSAFHYQRKGCCVDFCFCVPSYTP